jgi:hypothetical protein
MENMADWLIGGLYIVFVAGVIGYAYYEIKNRTKGKY